MSRRQNDQGRALEWAMIEKIREQFELSLGEVASGRHSQYEFYFHSLEENVQSRFIKAASKVCDWLEINHQSAIEKGLIDGLIDDAGTVADIVVGSKQNLDSVWLSVKHNNHVMRNNRPGGLPLRAGVAQTPEAKEFIRDLVNIERDLRVNNPGIRLFRDLENKNLYMQRIINICKNHLDTWQTLYPTSVPTLFKYLAGGDEPYYKIIVKNTNAGLIEIWDFVNFETPNKLDTSINSRGYLKLAWDNGWQMTMRIHNASSRLSEINSEDISTTGDWKFDVKLVSRPENIVTLL